MLTLITTFSLQAELPTSSSSVSDPMFEKQGTSMNSGEFINKSKKIGSPREAKNLVSKAMDYINKNGKETALKHFGEDTNKFSYKDLYIFIIDFNGNVLVHGAEPGLVGKNQFNLTDSYGKTFIQDFIKTMKRKDEAWVEYHWKNYETYEIESKLSYLRRIDGDLFIGCGVYFGK